MKAIQIVYSLYAFVPIGVCILGFPLILLSKTFKPIASIYYWFIFVVSDFLMLSRESKELRELLFQLMKVHINNFRFEQPDAINCTSDKCSNYSNCNSTGDAVEDAVFINIEREKETKEEETSSAPQSAGSAELIPPKVDPPREESSSGRVFRVLEIGPGTGTNLPFYPPGVNLSLIELNPLLHKQINCIRKKHPQITIDKVILGNAENMSACGIEDETFDAVVGTHILCCIKDASAALKEIRRILKPQGQFYTCEFVSYSDDTKSAKKWIQKAYAPFWSFFSLGCKAGNQNVAQLLKDHAFNVSSLIQMIHPTLPVTHAVTLYGSVGKL